METRANYAVVGIFTIAVIAAAFGFVFWFSGTDRGAKRSQYRVEFTGSVAGLAKGAPVLFNGIRVGDVTDVYFQSEKPQQAFAKIDVLPDTPVKEDTKASLDTALLSGTAVIALTGGSPGAPALQKKPNEDLPNIVAEKGGIGSLLESARGTADRATALLDNLNGIVTGNRDTINQTVRNLQVFSDALAKNAPALDNLLASVGKAAERIGPLAIKLEKLTDDTDALVTAIDRQRIARIVENVQDVTQTVASNREKLANIMQDTSTLVRGLSEATPKLDQALADAGRVVGAIDPVKLNGIVDNAGRFTTALGNSSRDVEQTARNANSLTAKLDAAAGRIDGVLKAAENFLGSAAGQEGKSTFESIRVAADAFAKASDNLNRRATQIAEGVTRFTGSGSREVQGVAVDARRTINDVGRAARNLERNPQSVIFGGGRATIPEYNGQ